MSWLLVTLILDVFVGHRPLSDSNWDGVEGLRSKGWCQRTAVLFLLAQDVVFVPRLEGQHGSLGKEMPFPI